jgi:hypothetical protein
MNYDNLKRKQTSKEAGKSRKNKEAGTQNPKEHPKNRKKTHAPKK